MHQTSLKCRKRFQQRVQKLENDWFCIAPSTSRKQESGKHYLFRAPPSLINWHILKNYPTLKTTKETKVCKKDDNIEVFQYSKINYLKLPSQPLFPLGKKGVSFLFV